MRLNFKGITGPTLMAIILLIIFIIFGLYFIVKALRLFGQ